MTVHRPQALGADHQQLLQHALLQPYAACCGIELLG